MDEDDAEDEDEDMETFSENGEDNFAHSDAGSAECRVSIHTRRKAEAKGKLTCSLEYFQYTVVGGDGDAYIGIELSKDEKKTKIEIDEPFKRIWVSPTSRGDYANCNAKSNLVEAELFGQQRCMCYSSHAQMKDCMLMSASGLSGCEIGNEQGQLFSLYDTLAGLSFSPSKCVGLRFTSGE